MSAYPSSPYSSASNTYSASHPRSSFSNLIYRASRKGDNVQAGIIAALFSLFLALSCGCFFYIRTQLAPLETMLANLEDGVKALNTMIMMGGAGSSLSPLEVFNAFQDRIALYQTLLFWLAIAMAIFCVLVLIWGGILLMRKSTSLSFYPDGFEGQKGSTTFAYPYTSLTSFSEQGSHLLFNAQGMEYKLSLPADERARCLQLFASQKAKAMQTQNAAWNGQPGQMPQSSWPGSTQNQ